LEIARPGTESPDGDSVYGIVNLRGIDDDGRVLFRAEYRGQNDQFIGDVGFYRSDGQSTIEIVRTGDASPDGNGRIANWGLESSAFNNHAQLAFVAKITETAQPPNDKFAIYRADGTSLVQIARFGQVGPPGAIYTSISDRPVLINDLGEIAFEAKLQGRSGTSLFLSNGQTTTELVHYGQTSPRGDGTLLQISDFALNNAGQVSFFTSVVTNPHDTNSLRRALFRADANGLAEYASVGEATPNGDGYYSGFPSTQPAVLNNVGQMTFFANLRDTSSSISNVIGLFRASDTGIAEIVRNGQIAPDGNGVFALPVTWPRSALNDAGDVVFTSALSGTSGGTRDDFGIFFWDDESGLRQIVRKDDLILGSTIVDLHGGFLNNDGEFAFTFFLADGRSGIAVWTIPEPISFTSVVLSVAMALCSWRRQYFDTAYLV
jgi:hypothetical protein